MPIEKPTSLPIWATGASVVEPSLGKKAMGWLAGERLPAGMLNWWKRNVGEWIRWMFAGSARTLPWQHTFAIPGAEGLHRAIAVLQSTTKTVIMVISDASPWTARTCDPVSGVWTTTTMAAGATPQTFMGLAANDQRFVAVGSSGRIQTFENGAWTARTAAAGYNGAFLDVVWDGTQFVAIGANFEVQTSPDGITWTRRVSTAPAAGGPRAMVSFKRIACGGSRLVRLGIDSGGYAALWYSDDGGTTWVWAYTSAAAVTEAAAHQLRGVTALDGTPVFAAVLIGGGGNVCVGSNGGIVWQVPSLPVSEFFPWLTSYNDLLLMSGGGLVSQDGLQWNLMPFLVSTDIIFKAAVSPQGWGLVSRQQAGTGNAEIARTSLQRWF